MTNNSNSLVVDFAIGLTAGILIPLGLPPLSLWVLSLIGMILLFSHTQRPLGKKQTAGALGFSVSYAMSGHLWAYYSQYVLSDSPVSEKILAIFTVFISPLLIIFATLMLYPVLRRRLSIAPYSIASVILFSCCWITFEIVYSMPFSPLPILISGYALLGLPSDALVPIFGVFGSSLTLVMVAGLTGSLIYQLRKKHSRSLPYLAISLLITLAAGPLLSRVEWTWPYDLRPFNYVMQTSCGTGAAFELLDTATFPAPRLALICGVKGDVEKPELSRQIYKLNESRQTAYLAQFSIAGTHCPYFYCSFGEGEGCIPEQIRKASQYIDDGSCDIYPLSITANSATRHPAADAYRMTVLSPLSDSHPFQTASESIGSEFIVAFDGTEEGQVFREWMIRADRARALETGRPLLRYSNIGMSVEINHQGFVLARFLPEQDLVTGNIQPMSGQTPFMYFGPYAPLSLIALALVVFSYRRLFLTL
ncbi:hypothetical protein [Sansalvadorimonas verongulae]|uniref:hypothetical protein n=1 Tax=Sansalvadorimonas verongulae TaxID=2172824 RepID=UPI0012BB9490|nr:hypothetical protein [Sansalvadorimonas verongulae]MTI14890.1 hypothetical protein [Sansalvadorimonas verongulae]